MPKNNWIADKIRSLDDEALFEVSEVVTEAIAGKEEEARALSFERAPFATYFRE